MKYCNTCKYFRFDREGSVLYDYFLSEGAGICCLVVPNFGDLTNSCKSYYYNKACPSYKDSIGAVYNISDEELDSYPPSFNSIHSYIRYIAKGPGPWEDILERSIKQ